MGNTKLKIITRDGRTFARTDTLHASPRNARLISDESVAAVAHSIEQFGFRQPIVVEPSGEIVAGHTRHRAALHLGFKQVWVELADDLSPAQLRAYRLVDNRTGELTGWDVDKLATELDGLADEEAAFADMLAGFDPEEIAALRSLTFMDADREKAPKASGPAKANDTDFVSLSFFVPRASAREIKKKMQAVLDPYLEGETTE